MAADTVVSFVINQLTTILSEEGRLWGGIREGVQSIKDELGHMRAFLEAAEAREDDNPRVQEWIKQVRDAAYDIEDLLDEFTFLFAHRHEKGFCGRCKRACLGIKKLKARRNIAGEIQSIKNRITNISDAHMRYSRIENNFPHHVAPVPVPSTINAWWKDELLEGKPKLVGIQEPKQKLVSELLEGDAGLKVISVVGMQGIGKTTLVKKVHEDPEVRNQFPIRAMVTADQNYTTVGLFKDLVRQIYEQIKKPISNIVESIPGVDGLRSFIRDLLQEKRYVIIVDDVSDVNSWNSIKSALPESSNGSRVMLTTRMPEVAQASGLGTHHVHKMKPLSPEESWNLFCNRTFKDNNCPYHLKHIAQDILSKCEGLPLAIVTMGGLLASKDHNNVGEWEMVQRSIGGEEDGLDELDRVKKLIHLNYKTLPSHLKNCLLYMSIFPKDCDVQCHHLIQLWIAERFVKGRGMMTYEEVAVEYLKELIRRSLVQIVELSWDGSPYQCRVHDLVREMILCKSQEQNMMTVVPEQHTRETEKVYRLVVHDFWHRTLERHNFNHLRSLITFGTLECLQDMLGELMSSKLLKVLDLRGAKLEEIPKGVFYLHHLKYLSLRGTKVKNIPRSIKKLQNLEHLHLGETSVRELPMEILKLHKLRHLRVFQVVDSPDSGYQFHGFKPPSNIGELVFLHTLLYIDAQNDKTTIVGELGKLIHLRELGITNLRKEDGKELCSSLKKLTNLHELDVAAIQKDEVIDMNFPLAPSSLQYLRGLTLRGRLERLPPWINQLHSVMKIELIWSRLSTDDDPLVSLQHLPNLVEICLTEASEKEKLHFTSGGFKKLETLELSNMNELKRVMIEKGSMPRLKRLYLSELPSLEELPLGIENLRQVQSLHLINLNPALNDRLLNEDNKSEEIWKTAHIQEVLVAFSMNGEWKECQL
ncbi:OLC1v1031514C1 [Oldenlandia corymbosa var. corymbosa]|uniref:OLC1v1031514C1 n=1 Tax=Oldenlandia corymbosa var. corymbosa TaxID=529605 RepID=A0AAV1CLH8_OLDCO|nr:OLC1v1031514C1 [Oldenlandia corymbosa var. corymbosa]